MGSKQFVLLVQDSVTWPRPRPLRGSIYDPDAVGVRPLCLRQIWSGYLSTFKSYKGVPKFRHLVTWPRPRALRGHFVVRTLHGPVLCVGTKLEADSSILSKVIRGSQHFEIGSRHPSHADLGDVLYFVRREGPSSMYIPNLKRIALFVQKLLWGPKFSKLGHVTLSHAPFET